MPYASFLRLALLAFVLGWSATAVQAQFLLDLETGVVYSSRYNTVRVPGNAGTQFDISKDFRTDPAFFYRIRAGYTFGKRHTVSALYAPLTVQSTGAAPFSISFFGAMFAENSPVNVRYRFNSYRVTYRYDLVSNEKLSFGLGLTAKIRDAAIRLSNGLYVSEKTNVGVVPLVNFYLSWRFIERFRFIAEGDALAARQGRAEDVFAGLGYQPNDHLTLKAGYRLLEGGADNEEVYNFTWYNYASVGAVIRW